MTNIKDVDFSRSKDAKQAIEIFSQNKYTAVMLIGIEVTGDMYYTISRCSTMEHATMAKFSDKLINDAFEGL